jgi:hypothetical protein
MSSDDNKMGIKELAGGAVIGTGVGYGVSAVSGRHLNKLKIEGTVKEIGSFAKDTGKSFIGDIERFSKEYKFAERGVNMQTFQTASNRASLKFAEKIGLDTAETAANLKFFNSIKAETFQDAENIGAYFKKLIEITTKQTKAVIEKYPTVGDYTKLNKESHQLMADTLAETIGLVGDERTKFVKDYMDTTAKYVKSTLGKLESLGRKVVGAVKYENAAWYEKPIVAFEAMSTKGKIGIGALVAASTLGAAFVINRLSGSKDTDQTAPSR